MSSALKKLIEIGRASCEINGGLLHVDFTREEKDYSHKEAHGTANGLGRCLPSPMMGKGAKLSFFANGQQAEIHFQKPHDPSRIIIRGERGRFITSGKGPTVGAFKMACDNSNLKQHQITAGQGNLNSATEAVKVFDELKNI